MSQKVLDAEVVTNHRPYCRCCHCHEPMLVRQVNIYGMPHGSTFVEVDMPGTKIRVASFGDGQNPLDMQDAVLHAQEPRKAEVVQNEPMETTQMAVQRKLPFFRRAMKAICGF